MLRLHRVACSLRLPRVLVTLLALIHPCPPQTAARDVAVHTNLLYWASMTPNLGAELGLGCHASISATFGYNAFNFPNHKTAKGFDANPKLHHWLTFAEGRYWLRHSFDGLYFGLHALGGQYNAGGVRLLPFLKNSHYEGWGAGLGIGVGYRMSLGHNWAVEASAGGGMMHLHYTKYECGSCGHRLYTRTRNTPALTKASISISYRFSTSPKHIVSVADDDIFISPSHEVQAQVFLSDTTVIPVIAPSPATTQAISSAEDRRVAKADTALFIIRYPVDRADYRPEFADNRAELLRLHATLDSIVASGNSVTHICITGYASPEYEADHNLRLSEARARSAAGAVVADVLPVGAPITLNARGADWEGLSRAVPGLNVATDTRGLLHKRDSKLSKALPQLRRAEIEIIYTVH